LAVESVAGSVPGWAEVSGFVKAQQWGLAEVSGWAELRGLPLARRKEAASVRESARARALAWGETLEVRSAPA